MRYLLFLLIFVISLQPVQAQSPKREFRGAWIATVANIDWPSKRGLPAIAQQQEFIQQLDELKKLGCNAVIVQIRPASDALYASKFEPWSAYLSGKQGEPPFPFYDPLAFMIAETHKRCMEFHAWFNPFRALVDSRSNPNPKTHITHTQPTWIINYGGKAYVDPGNPEAREYVINVITDVVKRYDIDAVHLDDYFYPYRIAGVTFGDQKSYAKYNEGMNREDWRRNNVSLFVSLLHTQINHIKPHVKFGISPFGIWRNKSMDADGSETRGGQTNYDDLYADVLLWMQKGWVDYLMPQLYWEHASKAAPFGVLLPWWYKHCYKRHIYYGLGLYRMNEAHGSGPWATEKELLWQIRDIRTGCPNSIGYAYYSASIFTKIKGALKDSLQNSTCKAPAFPPCMPWIDSIPPSAPELILQADKKLNILKWQVSNPKNEPITYVVYRFHNHEPINIEKTEHIVSVQQETTFTDMSSTPNKAYTYVVTAMDRLWNESAISNTVVTGK